MDMSQPPLVKQHLIDPEICIRLLQATPVDSAQPE